MSDVISRADAIEAVCRTRCGDKAKGCPAHSCLVIEEFDAISSADAVQGEWIDRSNGGRIKYPWWESCECNQCGEYGSGAYNYCPNCGAIMKGGDE